MIVLGIETATIEVGAAIYGDDGLIASFRARLKRRHVETLHPAIESLLELSGLELSGIDVIAVDIGPGLFTGLRVGVAAAKGFSMTRGLPIVACTSTEVLLFSIREEDSTRDLRAVVPVVDMRRGEVAFEIVAGELARLATVDEFIDELGGTGLSEVALIGDGASRYRSEIADGLSASHPAMSVKFFGDDLDAPNVASLAHLGYRRAQKGQTVDAASLDALYLRLPDAKANWSLREGSTRPGL